MIDGIINLLSSPPPPKKLQRLRIPNAVCEFVGIKVIVLIEDHTKHSNFIPRSLFIDNDPDRPPYKTWPFIKISS
jgi:hypothetical protein